MAEVAQNNADMADTETMIDTDTANTANTSGAAPAMEDEAEMMDEDAMMDDATPAATVSGTFEAYSPEKLALAADGDVVLFFHADWCPSCRGLEDDLNAQLSQIPANTHILKLDYDTETELKRQYGVVRQHTLVVVDANGAEIKKLTGLTNTLDQVLTQI